MWFKRKTFEEKCQQVKNRACEERITSNYAYLTYYYVAQRYHWEDVADHFYKIYIEEKTQQQIGE